MDWVVAFEEAGAQCEVGKGLAFEGQSAAEAFNLTSGVGVDFGVHD